MNYGLVDQQYKSTAKVLPQIAIFHSKRENIPCRYFSIYGISASSVEEKMTVVDVNYKDSGSEDTDAYVLPLSSFNHLTLGPYLSEVFN